jgi:hypothetical protein
MQTNLIEMAPTLLGLVFIAALAIVLSIGYHRLYNPVVEPRQCPHSLADRNLSVFSGLPSKDEIVSMLVHHPEKFPSECFFADDYFEARRLFLAQAKKLTGAELQSFAIQDVDHYMDRPNTSISPEAQRNYTIDVVILRGNPKKQVWHLSGTHGAEGYAGSAAQV